MKTNPGEGMAAEEVPVFKVVAAGKRNHMVDHGIPEAADEDQSPREDAEVPGKRLDRAGRVFVS